MNVNGNITLSEGGVVTNLTLPSGTAFPANGNLAEKFTLTEALDADHPAGEYTHDGTTWQNLPTLAEVKTLLTSVPVSFHYISKVLVSVPALSADSYWFNNAQATAISAGLPSATPLTATYLDPADFPAGAKLRLSLTANVNAVGTASSFVISMRKVTRPGSLGGTTDQVIYTADSTALGSISVPSADLVAQANLHYYSSEFDVPTAGNYAVVLVQTTDMTTDSCIQFSATLQAKH